MAGRRSIGNTFTVSTIDEPISVEAQYSPDKTVIHTVWQNGDIYMRTRETDGDWSDWHKIVGENGDETDFSFGISAFLTTANASTPPSDISTWSDAPIDITEQKPYLWSKVQKKAWNESTQSYVVTSTSYIRLTGESGASVQAQYAPNDNPTPSQIHDTWQEGDVYMRTKNTNESTWSDWNRIVGEKGGETDYSFGISNQQTTSSPTVAPTLKPNTTWSDAPVQTEQAYPYLWSKVQKKDGNGNNVGSPTYIRLTGEDGVIYSIESSIGSVTIASDATTGTLSNAVISFYKKTGDNQRQAYQCYCTIFQKKGSTYTNIRQYTSKSASVTYTHSTPALTVDNFDAIVVCIYDTASTAHSNYLTELEIPVRKQGDSGFNPPYYFEEWYAWSNDESTASVTTPPTIGGTWETSIPTQGSYAYLWRKSVKHIWNATTRQYSNEEAQYFRMSGTNGTSIKTKGNAIYIAINKSSFPTGTSTNDIALEEATKKPYKWNGSAWATTGMDDASDGDSYVISGACTFRGNDVEGHLISWSDEAAKWIDVGQFKGESGITYYTHVAWATNVNSSTTPITVTGFTTAKSPNDNTLVWMGVLVDTNAGQDSRNAALYTWSYIKGEGVYFADLENMMDSVACTNDGKPSSAQSVNTIVRMWKGATAVSFTIAVSKNGQAYPSSGSVITGTTCTWNNASGLITFAYAASNNVINTQDSYDITVTPAGGTSTDARTVTYKVNGIRAALNGEPAEIFALVPSANEVIKRKDGTLIPDGNTYITCDVTKNRGGSQSTPAASEYVLKYSLDERAHEYAYPNAGIKVSTIQSSLTFILYNPSQSQVLDIESIPLVIDGSDGDNAPYYEEDLYGWSDAESVADVNTEPTPNNGWTRTIPSQGSYAYLWKKIIGHTWNTTTKTYSNETPQYYRLSGTNGTSIKTKGSAVYVATSESSFPTSDLSVGDIALKESSKKPFKWNGSAWSTNGVTDAADGDSYVIERACIFKSKQVQGHLIMWSDEANNGNGAWIDLGQFKGADGTTWYTHVAWATDVTYDSSGQVISVTGFEPVKTASDTTHIWMGVLVDTNSGQDPQNPERYTWSNTKGNDGESSTSYVIRGGYDSITIPSGATTATLNASFSFYRKIGNNPESSIFAYYAIYTVSLSGTYSLYGQASYDDGLAINNMTIDDTISEVCIFLFPSRYDGDFPQSQPYYTVKSIKVIKNGDNGNDGDDYEGYYIECTETGVTIPADESSTLFSFECYFKKQTGANSTSHSCYYAVYTRTSSGYTLTQDYGYSSDVDVVDLSITTQMKSVVVYMFSSSYTGTDPESQTYLAKYEMMVTKWGDTGESSTSYIIRGGYDTITIPSDQTSTTISATYNFFQKTGTQNETSLNAYWSVYFVVNGSYSINSYGSGTSCTFNNKVISSSVSEVCIFLFPTSYAGGNPQNEKYYTMKSIKVVKNGDNGNDGESAPSATMNADQWVIRFYGSGKLVSEVSRTFLFYLKVGTNDATVTSVTASSLPTGVTITSPTLAYAKQVNVSNAATPDGILNGITFTVTGTYNNKTYSAPVTLALVPSVKGNTGRFYYYAGVYDNTNDDDENKFPISDAQAPYFKTTETTYHVFDPDQNPASGYMTMKEMWDATEGNPKSFNNDPWKQMWSEFKYIITEAIFGQYAQFGSAIINGDWQLCTSGTVDGVEKSGTTDYTRFDPQFPLGTGKIDFLGSEPIEILSQSSVYARMTEICEINVIAGCTYCLNLVGAKLTQETGTVYIYVCKYIDGVYTSIKSVYNSSTSASASARLAKITDFYFTPDNYGTIKIVGYVTNSWTDAEVESVTLEPSIGDSNMFVPNYALDMRTGKIYLNDAIIRGSIRAAKYEYKMFFAEDSSMSTAASASDADYVIVSTANNTTTVFESPKNYAGKVITIVNPTPRSQPYFSKIATSNGTIVPFASSTGGNVDYSIGLYSTVKIWADGNRNVWRVIEQVEY